jgi:hypothetical protein
VSVLPCDVFDPALPAAGIAAIWALSGLWARRGRWRTAAWAVAGLVLVVAVAVLVVAARAPGGCPA